MKPFLNNLTFLSFSLLLVGVLCCTQVEVIYPDDDEDLNVIFEGGNIEEIETDNGEIGVILDTRPIFRKGYSPEVLVISFPDYSEFDETLTIDPNLNLAKFTIRNDSLTQEQKDDFENGVATEITVSANQQMLASYSGEIVLNALNSPLSLETDLDFVPRPVVLKENLPYLMMFRYEYGGATFPSFGASTLMPGVIFAGGGNYLPFNTLPYNPIEKGPLQFFYFHHVQGNRYKIRLPQVCMNNDGVVFTCPSEFDTYTVLSDGGWIAFNDTFVEDIGTYALRPTFTDSVDNASVVELVQNQDGWLEMFVVENATTLVPWSYWRGGNFGFGEGFGLSSTSAQIRLVSDNVDYVVEDLGNQFFNPVIPAVQADFAFWSTISNCSASTITEEVGRVETISRQTSIATTESFQLFSSKSINASVTLGTKITAQSGGGEATGGSFVQGEISASVTVGAEFSTSSTETTEQTIGETITEDIEVSRVRTVTVTPYTGMEVFDYVKKVDNVRIPFVKTLKIMGRDKYFNTDLTGEELVSLCDGNLFGGIISKVEDNYIEITIRGNSFTNSFFESYSGANDLPDPCID